MDKREETAEAGGLKGLLRRNREIILYVVFGGMTTGINIAVYYLCFHLAGIPNVPSTILAWVAAVAFAYITNKLWVFESRSFDGRTLLREMLSFFGCRIATGLLDVGIMYVSVDVLHWNAMIWKVVSNVIVIISNYILSKRLVFRK